MPVFKYELMEDPLDVDKKKKTKEYRKEADPLLKLSNGTITEKSEDNEDNNTYKKASSRQKTDATRKKKHFRKGIREDRKHGHDGVDETSSFGSKDLDQLRVILKDDSVNVAMSDQERGRHKSKNRHKKTSGM